MSSESIKWGRVFLKNEKEKYFSFYFRLFIKLVHAKIKIKKSWSWRFSEES